MGNNSSIVTPGVKNYVFSPRSDTTSNLMSCTGSIDKFDTHIHGSTNQERNLESWCIEEVGVKIIPPEIVKESNSSGWVNLANSFLNESPKFISLRHPNAETADIRNIDFATSTKAKSLYGLRRATERDDMLGYTHGLKLRAKRKLTVVMLRILNLKLGKFLSGKLGALKIFNGHYQRIW